MNNKGLEVRLNDDLLCKAGIKNNHGGVHCIIGAIHRNQDDKQEFNLDVSGLNSDDHEYLRWIQQEKLKEGDIISIKIISDDFDKPKEVTEKKTDEFRLEQKIKAYNKLKEELKDHL